MLKQHALLRFGEYALDPVAKVLFKDGEPVRLTRKAVETLLVLAENPGQVLTKEEIMSAVWTDRVVDEANLAQNIAVIRRTLAAPRGSPAYIETFPGRGYRLEGPVTADTVVLPVEPGTPSGPVDVQPTRPEPFLLPAQPRLSRRAGFGITAAALIVAGAAGLWLWRSSNPGAGETEFRITPITRLPGTEYHPALSPDGRRAAFVWSEDSESPPVVWISVQGEADSRPISKAQGHHGSPAWSPDGRSLAYLRTGPAGTTVVVHDLVAGSEQTLATLTPPDYGFNERLLSWSPDGSLLAVSHSQAAGRPPGLWLVSIATGEATVLTQPGSAASGDVDPRFSPDGRQVSFIRLLNRAHQEIFTLPVAGGQPAQLTRIGKRISGHDWTSDGSALVLSSDRSGDFRLWRMPLNKPEALSAIGIFSEFPLQFAVARQAPALAYAALQQDRNIWRLDLQTLEWKRLLATTAQDASPVVSPSGERISFRSDRSGDEQLWVASRDGSQAVQVTRSETKPSVGRWSPDGKSLIFNNPKTFEISIATETPSGWTTRTTEARGVHPVFSADGQQIYAGGSSITAWPVADGGAATILMAARAEALAASKDGKFLYFMREPNDTTLWRLPLDTLVPEKVLSGIVPGCSSCWSVAADGVYFLGMDQESFDQQALFFHPFDGMQRDRFITRYPEPLWPQGSGPFSLSPDGRSLLCVRVAPSNNDILLAAPFR